MSGIPRAPSFWPPVQHRSPRFRVCQLLAVTLSRASQGLGARQNLLAKQAQKIKYRSTSLIRNRQVQGYLAHKKPPSQGLGARQNLLAKQARQMKFSRLSILDPEP